MKNRIWELDFFRGIALLLMIYFHFVFDLQEILGINIPYSGINYYLGKTSAVLFMFISGISFSLSKSNIKRGIKLLVIAMIVTIVTHLYNPEVGVKFGILHFLGVSILLGYLFQKALPLINVLAGIIIIILDSYLDILPWSYDFLFPLGIYTERFYSADYYPLIPWFGVFLFGLAFGQKFYQARKSLLKLHMKDNLLNQAGRHTLLLYLIHQPILIVTLSLFK